MFDHRKVVKSHFISSDGKLNRFPWNISNQVYIFKRGNRAIDIKFFHTQYRPKPDYFNKKNFREFLPDKRNRP